jgi:hypothetical protein
VFARPLALVLAACLAGCSGEVRIGGPGSLPGCPSLAGREGSCERDDGSVARIVDRTHPVRLRQLRARLLGVRTEARLTGPNGTFAAGRQRRFVVATLAVSNEQTGIRAGFAHPKPQVFLYVDGREYRQNRTAERLFLRGSFARRGQIAPGREARGRVVFRVPARRAARLRRAAANPELGVVNFSEAGGAQPREWGFIRLAR